MPLLMKYICKSFKHQTVINNTLKTTYLTLIGKRNLHSDRTIMCDMKFSTIKAANEFKFTWYDCIGFDLDNTVCRYKIGAMAKLEYEAMSRFLVEERGYSSKHLLKPLEKDLDFVVKGLIIDAENGNMLRIGSDGRILNGSHGTKQLSRKQLEDYYGTECRWHATDLFIKDPLHTWNGPLSERMRTLLDYFDLPAGLVFARAVDGIDEEAQKKVERYTIWPDLLDALINMFQKEHFFMEKGGYFPEMKANPEKYIHKCSEDLMTWFRKLKANNKCLFLITGSNVDFASHTASYALGEKWSEFFDIVVCFAKKPGFFTGNRKFVGLNGFEEAAVVEAEELEAGKIYTYGNFNDLHEFLKRHTKLSNPKLLYVGDNLIQDVYTPSVHTVCDTVAVVEELQAEGKFGHVCDHVDHLFIVSSMWGSYFEHSESDCSFWKNIIQKHSKLCIPSLEYVAKHPLDHTYRSEA